jgi:hypothetical protein
VPPVPIDPPLLASGMKDTAQGTGDRDRGPVSDASFSFSAITAVAPHDLTTAKRRSVLAHGTEPTPTRPPQRD